MCRPAGKPVATKEASSAVRRIPALQGAAKFKREMVVFTRLPFKHAYTWQEKFRFFSLLEWWYLCLGAGFLLMGIFRLIHGEKFWLVFLRWVLAAGFLALAFIENRSKSGRNKKESPGDNLS
jgi:hypothetical protein